MEILAPGGLVGATDIRTTLDDFNKTALLSPFSPEAIDFVSALSSQLLTDKSYRTHPELIAMAHWMRPARITELKKEFDAERRGRVRKPCGTVFHLAPSNVDTIFIYSWILSLLLGNRNIMRLSNKRGEVAELLISLLNSLLSGKSHAAIALRTLVVSYGHDQEATALLSGYCSARVIWGGDETVRTIRSVALPPTAREIVFPDRFSMAMLSATAVLEANAKEFDQLVRNFGNDSFYFDQLACSSPRLVLWCGTNEQCSEAQDRFWPAVVNSISNIDTSWGPATGITRMATAYTLAAQGLTTRLSSAGTDICLRLRVEQLSDALRTSHCGGGMFYEMNLASPEEVTAHLCERDQTLAYFGFDRGQLHEFAEQISGTGLSRIVPIGTALQFHHVWDGMNLLSELSREVTIL